MEKIAERLKMTLEEFIIKVTDLVESYEDGAAVLCYDCFLVHPDSFAKALKKVIRSYANKA